MIEIICETCHLFTPSKATSLKKKPQALSMYTSSKNLRHMAVLSFTFSKYGRRRSCCTVSSFYSFFFIFNLVHWCLCFFSPYVQFWWWDPQLVRCLPSRPQSSVFIELLVVCFLISLPCGDVYTCLLMLLIAATPTTRSDRISRKQFCTA